MPKNKRKIEAKHVGPIIGTLIVIMVVIATALYAFASHINKQTLLDDQSPSSNISAYSNSPDDIQTLKNDLNNAIK
jgi:hypothetical protein